MKHRCAESARVQDFIDEQLPPAEADAFRAHLDDCERCSRDLSAYRRVFRALGRPVLVDPGPALTDRILAAVVPAMVRRRWLRTAGWAYAGSLGASVVAGTVAVNLPGTRMWLELASSEASRHAVQLVVFVLNTLGFAALGVANGWGALAVLATRIAPVPRALGSLLQHPPIEVALWAAAVICGVLLWSLHGRERTSARRAGPLGLMGV